MWIAYTVRNMIALRTLNLKSDRCCATRQLSKISYSSVNFFSDRDEVLLVSEEFVLTEELGIRQRGLPTSKDHYSPEEFGSQISDRCCAMRQLSQNILPPNGHIIEGHLCLIMSGCSLGYK